MKKRFRTLATFLTIAICFYCGISYCNIVPSICAESYEDEELEEEETLYGELPNFIMKEVKRQKSNYPSIKIGVGIYSLDGYFGYEYNADALIAGGCTIKAPYALYVLTECENQGIDIYEETITYTAKLFHGGSGDIRYSKYGTKYTIAKLLDKLLGISDNTAYYMLQSKFPLKNYQKFIDNFDGQKLALKYNQAYGYASVSQRRNEWLAIYDYITSDSLYSDALRGFLSNTNYCYIVQGMSGSHEYMHKSGWSYGSYSCACDCAIIDESYLVIILTEDNKTQKMRTNAVKQISRKIEEYVDSLDGQLFEN